MKTTIIPYNYSGFNYPVQKVWVRKSSPSPDPQKKMIWGDGEVSPVVSDFKGLFQKAGKPVELEFTPKKYATRNQEKEAEGIAIRNFIANQNK
jgi:hypothetical protein